MTQPEKKKKVAAASPHANVPYRIRVLAQLLSRRLQRRLEPFDLTPSHYLVLRCLWKQDGLPISHIGDRVQQVGGTMTGVIDRMEERGLITRKQDQEDRRVWRAWLTDKGRGLAQRLPPVMSAAREQLLAGISDDDLERFADVLDRLINNANLDLKEG